MALAEDLRRVAEVAIHFADPGEELTGIVPTEPATGARAYLCAYEGPDGETSWLVVDDADRALVSRAEVKAAVSIAALCELADEVAGGGDLDELRSRLVALRVTENPSGIDEAEEAAHALQATIGGTPRVATPAHLDAVGSATLKLEQALNAAGPGGSPFAAAMTQAAATVEELANDVESHYKIPLT
jgi:hypothetical protein